MHDITRPVLRWAYKNVEQSKGWMDVGTVVVIFRHRNVAIRLPFYTQIHVDYHCCFKLRSMMSKPPLKEISLKKNN